MGLFCLASFTQGYTYELYSVWMGSGKALVFIAALYCINVACDISDFSVVRHLYYFQSLFNIILNKIIMNDIGKLFEDTNKISCVDYKEWNYWS